MRSIVDGQTYERVYLQYNRCVWSEFGNGAEDYDNGCAGDGNGDAWYMGHTQCYRANVAYSLYAVPYGQAIPENPCQKSNFINSFFTTHGVEYFSNTMGIDNGDATANCEVYAGGDDDFYANHNVAGENGYMLYPNYSSYTTTCSIDGSFVQGLFKGAYCSSRDGVNTLDTLDDFNAIVDDMTCVQVYNAANSGGNYQDDDGNNNGDRQLEGDDGLAGLLAYSDTCAILEYPLACPDPFGAKAFFEYKPESQKPWWQRMTWMDYVGCVFLFFALLLFLLPGCNFEEEEEDDTPKKKRRWCTRRRGNDKVKRRGIRAWFRRKRTNNSS